MNVTATFGDLQAIKQLVESHPMAEITTIIMNPGPWRMFAEVRFDLAHPALAPKKSKRRSRRRLWLYKGSAGPALRIPNVRIRPIFGLPWKELGA